MIRHSLSMLDDRSLAVINKADQAALVPDHVSGLSGLRRVGQNGKGIDNLVVGS